MTAALRALLLVSLVVSFALPLSGCGAAMSTYLILAAQIEVDAAEAAEAEQYAPYEYTAAQEYLHKAREEQGYADFGPAIEYAFMAQEYAEKATARAEKVKREQQPPPGAPTEPIAPVEPEPTPAEGIIIRKKPEVAPAPEPPTPGPEATEPAPELELVPPTPGEGDGEASGETETDENTELQIVPVEPEQPPTAPAPQG